MAATRAINEWVANHAEEWTVSLNDERTLVRPASSTSCSQGGKNNLVALRYATADAEIDLYFRCPVDAAAGVDDLRAAFAFAVLTELPHGIELPGWEFVVRTPSSHVMESVTFEGTANLGLNVRIETPLYSVSGRSVHPSCEPPADAPALPGCFVFKEHRIPLRLTLSARVDASQLD